MGGNPNPPKRSNIGGWSNAAARRNVRFLYSVREKDLNGLGFAVTLTLRDCPQSHVEWEKLRRRYIQRLRRMGMIRLHWVTEWQRRGVPHLHFAVWFPEPEPGWEYAEVFQSLTDHWLNAGAADYGAGDRGQFVTRINDAIGWFQYVAKHAARGAQHYQRSDDAVPKHWEKTGRMWGRVGNWPVDEAMKFTIDRPGFFAFRRIVQRWRLADARSSGDINRIRAARRMLQANDRTLGEIRGVSEWISMDVQTRILVQLGSLGYQVEQIE